MLLHPLSDGRMRRLGLKGSSSKYDPSVELEADDKPSLTLEKPSELTDEPLRVASLDRSERVSFFFEQLLRIASLESCRRVLPLT